MARMSHVFPVTLLGSSAPFALALAKPLTGALIPEHEAEKPVLERVLVLGTRVSPLPSGITAPVPLEPKG